MALSKVVAVGDGTTIQYPISFTLGYIAQSNVTCRVNKEVDGFGAPLYRTLTWINPGLVQHSGAPAGVGQVVEFLRTVDDSVLLADFADGANMTDENLDLMGTQMLMLIHQVLDGRFPDGFSSDMDMNGFKVTNLGDPFDPQDAATRQFVIDTLSLAQSPGGSFLSTLGGTMTGPLVLANSTPSLGLHATSKDYVSDFIEGYSGNIQGPLYIPGNVQFGTISITHMDIPGISNVITTDFAGTATKFGLDSLGSYVRGDGTLGRIQFAPNGAEGNAYNTFYVDEQGAHGFATRWISSGAGTAMSASSTFTAAELLNEKWSDFIVITQNMSHSGVNTFRFEVSSNNGGTWTTIATTGNAASANNYDSVVKITNADGVGSSVKLYEVTVYNSAGTATFFQQVAYTGTPSGPINAVRWVATGGSFDNGLMYFKVHK
jgi:hypothetical protein